MRVQGAAKSSPLNFIAVFLATVQNLIWNYTA